MAEMSLVAQHSAKVDPALFKMCQKILQTYQEPKDPEPTKKTDGDDAPFVTRSGVECKEISHVGTIAHTLAVASSKEGDQVFVLQYKPTPSVEETTTDHSRATCDKYTTTLTHLKATRLNSRRGYLVWKNNIYTKIDVLKKECVDLRERMASLRGEMIDVGVVKYDEMQKLLVTLVGCHSQIKKHQQMLVDGFSTILNLKVESSTPFNIDLQISQHTKKIVDLRLQESRVQKTALECEDGSVKKEETCNKLQVLFTQIWDETSRLKKLKALLSATFAYEVEAKMVPTALPGQLQIQAVHTKIQFSTQYKPKGFNQDLYIFAQTGPSIGMARFHNDELGPFRETPLKNRDFTSVTIGDDIFVMHTHAHSKDLFSYNKHSRVWTKKAPMLDIRENMSSAVLGGKIYVFSRACRKQVYYHPDRRDDARYDTISYKDKLDSLMESYDPVKNLWSHVELQNPCTPDRTLWQHQGLTIGNQIYILMRGVSHSMCGIFTFTPGDNKLVKIPGGDKFFEMDSTMVANDGFLYVIGGREWEKLPKTVQCFDLQRRVWREDVAQLQDGCSKGHAVVFEGRIHVFGGKTEGSRESHYRNKYQRFMRVQRYDAMNNKWEFVDSLRVNVGNLQYGVVLC